MARAKVDLPEEYAGLDSGDALVLALSRGVAYREAARLAGLSTTTAWERAQRPETRKRIAEARSQLLDGAIGKLAAVAGDAIGDTTRACSPAHCVVGAAAFAPTLDRTEEIKPVYRLVRRSVQYPQA